MDVPNLNLCTGPVYWSGLKYKKDHLREGSMPDHNELVGFNSSSSDKRIACLSITTVQQYWSFGIVGRKCGKNLPLQTQRLKLEERKGLKGNKTKSCIYKGFLQNNYA